VLLRLQARTHQLDMMQLLQRAAELSVRDRAFLHANYTFINIIKIC